MLLPGLSDKYHWYFIKNKRPRRALLLPIIYFMQDAKNKYFKKEYLIEAHLYVKGRFKLHFPDCVKSSSLPKFGLCSEETGSTN